MSIKIMNMVFESTLPPNPKIVMLALADYADASGYCYPGQEKLSLRTSIPVRTLRRIISQLEDEGWIVRQRRFDENGGRKTDGYYLQAAKLAGTPTGQMEGGYRPAVAATEEPPEPPENNKKRGVRKAGVDTPIPADWKPTEDHIKRASEKNLDVDREAELFRAHAETYGRVAKQWNLAFTTWLIKAEPLATVTRFPARGQFVEPAPVYPTEEELARRKADAIERSKNADWKPPVPLTPEELARYEKPVSRRRGPRL